jgi:hypothetical protein
VDTFRCINGVGSSRSALLLVVEVVPDAGLRIIMVVRLLAHGVSFGSSACFSLEVGEELEWNRCEGGRGIGRAWTVGGGERRGNSTGACYGL